MDFTFFVTIKFVIMCDHYGVGLPRQRISLRIEHVFVIFSCVRPVLWEKFRASKTGLSFYKPFQGGSSVVVLFCSCFSSVSVVSCVVFV